MGIQLHCYCTTHLQFQNEVQTMSHTAAIIGLPKVKLHSPLMTGAIEMLQVQIHL